MRIVNTLLITMSSIKKLPASERRDYIVEDLSERVSLILKETVLEIAACGEAIGYDKVQAYIRRGDVYRGQTFRPEKVARRGK